MVGIENLRKSFQLVKELVDTVEAILADGQVNLTDIKELPALYSASTDLFVCIKAVIDSGEAKDLEGSEIGTLMGDAWDLGLYVFKKF